MAMGTVKLPIICRPCVGILRKNGVRWNWCRGLHGLPQDGSVSYLRNSVNGAEVYMVGTCHISSKSSELVKQVIAFVKPNIIAVELCQKRLQSYQQLNTQLKSHQQSFFKILLNSLRFPGTLHAKLVNLVTRSLYHMLHVRGFDPGKEFKIALEECKRLDAQLLLIDQDLHVTVRNLGQVPSSIAFPSNEDVNLLKQLARFLMGRKQIDEYLENTTQRNFVRKITETMTRVTPEIARVIFTERDQIMFGNLRKCEGKIVAVVGMGHMDGIERMWKDIEQYLCG